MERRRSDCRGTDDPAVGQLATREKKDPVVELEACTAIVTGGASGIGEAVVRQLAQCGTSCVIFDTNEDGAALVAAEVGGVAVAGNVGSEEDVSKAVEAATERAPLRILVNAAGIGPAARTVGRDGAPQPLHWFERVLRVNLIGVFNCTRLAAAAMAVSPPLGADGGRGCIVNVSSVAAFDGQIGQAAYAASKAGVVGMTLPIARDLANIGIRVNTIAPGLVDTPIYGPGPDGEKLKRRLTENVLFPRRMGFSGEIATMVTAVLANDYVNGETIRVDGGIRMPPR